MPALAHIGVGFAAKKVAPKVSVGYLILAAEFVEIIFMVFWLTGIECPPTDAAKGFSPYSHSLVMGILWSLVAGGFTLLITKKRRLSIIIAALVFSHTLLDIIASPKTAFYPNDTGMPVFLNTQVTIGLGLWKNKIVGLIGEYGILAAGILIYVMTIRKNKKINHLKGEIH